MAIKTVLYSTPICLRVKPCQEVTIGLIGDWTNKTVSDLPFLTGTVENGGRELGSREDSCCCSMENVRGEDLYQYTISYDDAQLEEGIDVLCSDILGVSDDPIMGLVLENAVVGAQGAAGAQGAQGSQGAQGAQGAQGPQGTPA